MIKNQKMAISKMLILISLIGFTLFAEGIKEISYGAMGGNDIPCNRKTGSNANCHPTIPTTPYQRGCSPLTRCRGRPPLNPSRRL